MPKEKVSYIKSSWWPETMDQARLEEMAYQVSRGAKPVAFATMENSSIPSVQLAVKGLRGKKPAEWGCGCIVPRFYVYAVPQYEIANVLITAHPVWKKVWDKADRIKDADCSEALSGFLLGYNPAQIAEFLLRKKARP